MGRLVPPEPLGQIMTDFAAARLNMVESQVRVNSVTDGRVIEAMSSVPAGSLAKSKRRNSSNRSEIDQ